MVFLANDVWNRPTHAAQVTRIVKAMTTIFALSIFLFLVSSSCATIYKRDPHEGEGKTHSHNNSRNILHCLGRMRDTLPVKNSYTKMAAFLRIALKPFSDNIT